MRLTTMRTVGTLICLKSSTASWKAWLGLLSSELALLLSAARTRILTMATRGLLRHPPEAVVVAAAVAAAVAAVPVLVQALVRVLLQVQCLVHLVRVWRISIERL